MLSILAALSKQHAATGAPGVHVPTKLVVDSPHLRRLNEIGKEVLMRDPLALGFAHHHNVMLKTWTGSTKSSVQTLFGSISARARVEVAEFVDRYSPIATHGADVSIFAIT